MLYCCLYYLKLELTQVVWLSCVTFSVDLSWRANFFATLYVLCSSVIWVEGAGSRDVDVGPWGKDDSMARSKKSKGGSRGAIIPRKMEDSRR